MSAAILGWLVGVAAAVVVSIAVAEAKGWLKALARLLVRLAARQLPRKLRPRWEAEWLAEIEGAKGERPLSLVVWALGLRRAAATIADDRPEARRIRRSPRASARDAVRVRTGPPNENLARLMRLHQVLARYDELYEQFRREGVDSELLERVDREREHIAALIDSISRKT